MMNFANGDKYAAFLHDAVILYAVALNETIARGLDYRSGVVVASHMRNRLFSGSFAEHTVLQVRSALLRLVVHLLCICWCLRCFDAVGWAAGRASGL